MLYLLGLQLLLESYCSYMYYKPQELSHILTRIAVDGYNVSAPMHKQRSLTHHSQFPRLGIQYPTLVYVMFVGSGLIRWVSFYSFLFGQCAMHVQYMYSVLVF